MENNIKKYARIGLVHHMLYSECLTDAACHVRTLAGLVRRSDIETLDCCIPYGAANREAVVPAVRACGKEIVYALHLFPLKKISLATTCPQEQGLTKLVINDQINQAAAIGATGFVFASGADVPESDRPAAGKAFKNFCRWFCGELKPKGITALLEPFDRAIDKKYLYGPTEECVELVESLKPEADNFGIELDMAHVPLMNESFEHAIKTVAPHLKRVHLGNCVMKDRQHPWYGDRHPPIGLEGGEIDVPELAEIFRLLLDTGYLSRESRGALVMEMQAFPGKSVEDTIIDNLERIDQAWKQA